MKNKDTAYFQETKSRMTKAGWGPHAIRTMFNNSIVDDVNLGKMTLVEAKMHYPAILSHPLLNKPCVS